MVKLINRVAQPMIPVCERSLGPYRANCIPYTEPSTIVPINAQKNSGRLFMLFVVNLLTYQYYADRTDFRLFCNYILLPDAFRAHIFLREYFFRLTHY